MQPFLYFAGFTYIALCGAILVRESIARRAPGEPPVHAVPVQPERAARPGSAEGWFAAIKPYCNPVEVDVRVRSTPPPGTPQGLGFAAACFALAGKIDRARELVERLPRGQRASVAVVLFNVAHPVADAGDDRASGPMMQLVLEYWPDNYMALYHAGMSEYSLGQTALAEKHLREFLALYNAPDGFTSAARGALEKIELRRGRLPVPKVEREATGRP